MHRLTRDEKRGAGRRGEPAPFRHSSEHDDLAAVISDHLLDEERKRMTAAWRPSRRGNSPLGPGAKPRPENSDD